MAKRRPAGEQAKGLTLTIRISPKTKFIMELLARKQRRTVSAVIEWLAMRAAEDTFAVEDQIFADGEMHTVKSSFLLDELWNADEIIRFINLFNIYPELMTYDEELIIDVIRKEPGLFVERSCSLFFEVKDGETDAQIRERILNSHPDSNRYILFSTDYIPDQSIKIRQWIDLALAHKAWPYIKKAANQEISQEELHRIVEELKDGIEIQQADAPGVPKARTKKKDQ